MEQRDLLKAEIERIGQAIEKALARFLGAKGYNLPPAHWEAAIRQGLKDGPNLSIKALMDLDKAELIELARERPLSEKHLE